MDELEALNLSLIKPPLSLILGITPSRHREPMLEIKEGAVMCGWSDLHPCTQYLISLVQRFRGTELTIKHQSQSVSNLKRSSNRRFLSPDPKRPKCSEVKA